MYIIIQFVEAPKHILKILEWIEFYCDMLVTIIVSSFF